MSTTYKAVEVTKPGEFSIVEKSLRDPEPGHVRVRVEACGVCHSDSGTVEGLFPIEWPRVPGHEAVGREPLHSLFPDLLKEVGLMAGQTIEFANGQGYAHNLVVRNKSSRFVTVAELSASIVHQLKQPLTSMLANAQAAKRWLAAEPTNLTEAIASIDRIARDTRAAVETVDRIWALFKQAPLDKKDASVPDMMSEALRVILEDPNKREVPIEWHFDENLPKVCVDARAIQEVFINLTSNAMEAMGNTKSPLVEVRAAVTAQNEMLVQVIDNGPGIGDTEEIFDAFLTTKENGLGIGLAVSRSIAKAHGGRLWAENNPSGGATFCLALPLRSRNQIPTLA